METGGLGVHYFVNPIEFTNHPVIGAEFAKEGVKVGRVVEEFVNDDSPATEDQKDSKEKDSKQKSKKKQKQKLQKVVRGKGKKCGPALRKFEDTVDQTYTQDLYARCRAGMNRKEQRKDAEVGIFGFGTDWDKVKQIQEEVIESCEELKRLGVWNSPNR